MIRNGYKLSGGILFAILLNFKHIYIYIAPAYFVYFLRTFCISPSGQFRVKNFLAITNAVIAVFVVSFGPFIIMGQLPQVLSRLFPFTRGLNHAYWAPNVWALVTALDRLLLKCVQYTGTNIAIDFAGLSSTSRGLVGDTAFAILPNIKPVHTFAISLVLQMVWLVKLWFTPTYQSFVTAVTLCGYTSFLFGWHVHEKAILLVLVPLSLIATQRHAYFRTFLLASVAGVFSLFPLLFTPYESVVKVIYSFLWIFFVSAALSRKLYEFPKSPIWVLLDWFERLYLAGFPLLAIFVTFLPALERIFLGRVHRGASENIAIGNSVAKDGISSASKMEFFPLMLTSVYCAIGLTWAFIRLICIYLQDDNIS